VGEFLVLGFAHRFGLSDIILDSFVDILLESFNWSG